MAKPCPSCTEPLAAPYVSCSFCDWQSTKRSTTSYTSTQSAMTPEAKATYEAAGKTSADLTERQWYNVCRFFPTVARRCKRKFADVSPHNPLHATSKLGPMMGNNERPYIDYEVTQENEHEELL